MVLRRFWISHALLGFTLALGVGTSAAMFGLVDVFLYRDAAGVRDPSRIVHVSDAGTYRDYLALQAGARTLDLAAYRRTRKRSWNAFLSWRGTSKQCQARGHY
jgi:hypothetical protein